MRWVYYNEFMIGVNPDDYLQVYTLYKASSCCWLSMNFRMSSIICLKQICCTQNTFKDGNN